MKVADQIAVFYAGTTLEIAPVKDFCGFGNELRHPYSKALRKALMQNDSTLIPDYQLDPDAPPIGCLFQPHCSIATEKCKLQLPEMQNIRNGMVMCFHAF